MTNRGESDRRDTPLLQELTRIGTARMSLDEERALAVLEHRLFRRRPRQLLSLGRYRLRERLGSGGLGVVYCAADPVLRRDVAIKVVRQHAEVAGASPRVASRLKTEGQMLASLDHPNIVRIYGAGTDAAQGVLYTVMELIEGPTLRQWLVAEPRSTSQILAKFAGAGQALAAAHRMGILHRDFKSDNVLIDVDGAPRVADFGGMGTPSYMPPEQRAGRTLDERSDVYSMCCACREALGDRRISGPLARILRHGCDPDPGKRPQKMEIVVAALEPARRRRPVLVLGGVGVAAALLVIGQPESGETRCGVEPDLAEVELTDPAALAQMRTHDRHWELAFDLLCTPPARPTPRQEQCMRQTQAEWAGTQAALERDTGLANAVVVLDGQRNPLLCASGDAELLTETALSVRFAAVSAELTADRELQPWPEVRGGHIAALEEIRVAANLANETALQARVAMKLGLIAIWDLRHQDALLLFEDAHTMAIRAELHGIAVECARYRTRVSTMVGLSDDDAWAWLAAAKSAAKREGSGRAMARVLVLEARLAEHRPDGPARVIDLTTAAEASLGDVVDPRIRPELHVLRGFAYVRLEEGEPALADFARAREFNQMTVNPDSAIEALGLNGQGVAHRMLGQHEEAIIALKSAADLLERIQPGTPDLGATRGNLAQLYADQGRVPEALEQFRLVRAVFEEFSGPKHPYVTQTSYAIAGLLASEGDLDEARREAESALRWGLRDKSQEYGARLILARAAVDAEDLETARREATLVVDAEETNAEDRAAAAELLKAL